MSELASNEWCVWDDCDQGAIYCEGHAREYMQPDIDALRAEVARLRGALRAIVADIDKLPLGPLHPEVFKARDTARDALRATTDAAPVTPGGDPV